MSLTSLVAHLTASSGDILLVAAFAIMSGMMKLFATSSAAGVDGPGYPNTAHHSSAVSRTLSLSAGCELGSFERIGSGFGTMLANSGWSYPVEALNASV